MRNAIRTIERQDWTPEQEAKLMQLVKEGHPETGQKLSYAAIAQELDRTRGSTVAKAHYMGVHKYPKRQPRAQKPVTVTEPASKVNSNYLNISLEGKDFSDIMRAVQELENRDIAIKTLDFERKELVVELA